MKLASRWVPYSAHLGMWLIISTGLKDKCHFLFGCQLSNHIIMVMTAVITQQLTNNDCARNHPRHRIFICPRWLLSIVGFTQITYYEGILIRC